MTKGTPRPLQNVCPSTVDAAKTAEAFVILNFMREPEQ